MNELSSSIDNIGFSVAQISQNAISQCHVHQRYPVLDTKPTEQGRESLMWWKHNGTIKISPSMLQPGKEKDVSEKQANDVSLFFANKELSHLWKRMPATTEGIKHFAWEWHNFV